MKAILKETVLSKDGKTRITRFEVKWRDTDELTVEDSLKRDSRERSHAWGDKYKNWTISPDNYINYQNIGINFLHKPKNIKLDWSISGERTYKPGQIRVNLPYVASLENKQDLNDFIIGYEIDTDKTPVPKLIRNDDGSIDASADYGKSDYAWEKIDNTFSLVNIKELLPGTTGTATVSYKTSPQGNLRLVENSAIANIEPNITIDISKDETLKKEDKTLSIKLNKDVNVCTFKNANYYSSWNEDWGDNIKPNNADNYEYVIYNVRTTLYTQYATGKLKLEDTIGENQEILGFRNSKKKLHRSSSSDPSYLKDDTVYGGFEKYDNSINGIFEMDYPIEGNKTNDKSQGFQEHYLYLLVKVPYKDKGYDKPERDFNVKYRNDVKATLIPHETSIAPATATHGITITRYFKAPIPDAKFTAPPGDTFGIQKYTSNKYNSYYKKSGKTIKMREDAFKNYEPDVTWLLESTSNLYNLTRDENFGDENNPESYGKRKYKYVVSDDYLYLNGDYKNELSGEDYEVTSVGINVRVYYYGLYNNNKSIGYYDVKNDEKSNKTMPTAIYGRKSSTGEWVKLATFDYAKKSASRQSNDGSLKCIQNFKPLVDGVSYNGGSSLTRDMLVEQVWGFSFSIPGGYSSTKIEVETNNAKINVTMKINAKIKRSERVNEVIKNSKTDKYPMDLTLRNDSTLSVYDEDNNLIAIKGTSEKDEDNSRTLDLDKENYGAEMYHDSAYYNIKVDEVLKPKIVSSLSKLMNSGFNDVNKQEFRIPVTIKQEYYSENANENYLYENYKVEKQGGFYDLLPLGVNFISDLELSSGGYNYYNKLNYKNLINKDDPYGPLEFNYELLPNWRNSGRTMLIVKPKNLSLKHGGSYNKSGDSRILLKLTYTMHYSWESYEDYGGNIDRNLVGYELKSVDSNILTNGYNNPKDWTDFKDYEVQYYESIGDKGSKFVYGQGSTKVNGNTIAVTGLHKHVKAEGDSKYVVETKVKEGGSYSYRMRFVSESGTTTRDLILYDSLENYDPLKSNKYYGKKQWKGTLESIDTSQAKLKGADPKVYVSTIENLNIKKNRDLTDTSVWKPYNEGDDLSKVKAVAVDLTKRPNGSKFELPELQSINTILHMRAPDTNKDSLDAMSLNQVFANNTPIRKEAIVENDLIDQANTAVHLETIETEATIKAKKSYLDKKDKAVDLKGNDFTFKLKDDKGNTLQTKTNDNKGNITFDPIKYNSWDVGEHTYTIEEIKGNDNKIDYDNHVEAVKVNVERIGDSELKATVVYDADNSIFTNREKATASLQVVKLIDGTNKVELDPIKDNDGNILSYKVSEKDKDKALDGAEYELYKTSDSNRKNVIATIKTVNGVSNVVSDLEAGKYILKETRAPGGYEINPNKIEINIEEKDLGTIKIAFVNDKAKANMPSTGMLPAKFLISGLNVVLLFMGLHLIRKKKTDLHR